MTEILSQEEIDALLDAIGMDPEPQIDTLQDLSNYLIQKRIEKKKNSFEEQYVNLFQGPHIQVTKSLINNVYTQAAVKEPKAIVKIGNIEIIPINICPTCNNYHYDEEVQEIYSESKPDKSFISKNKKLKEYDLIKKWKMENRTICCKKCKTYFQPTIVYSKTHNSIPYFCKLQTVKTLDDWFLTERKSKIQLFSLKTKTIKINKNRTSFLWNVFLNKNINGMETCPQALLTNIVRYTPIEHLEKMLRNEKNIPVFNSFDFTPYYKPTQIFNEI
ncbi:MAG TPA: hypothetical protein PK079_11930 [Leptospiraceae bacterium]|nr:hypothetical protein [Leptospiraceae bacterium]HMW07111.1 hypothetical protein [Leptospiraceae bacterium]HMX31785.1 hypothetical protein [Leptospiraceae bacterium]HMY32572.1 hypothetical protein [Leptospiraceae bacterium]HMZ63894.1 hypothetical protein [Leptospiraceae bacterium]